MRNIVAGDSVVLQNLCDMAHRCLYYEENGKAPCHRSQSMDVALTMKEKDNAEIRLFGALWYLARTHVISESKARELANVPAGQWDRVIREMFGREE